jgi:GntR family transcriptional repressor for pyruvate dehydrogenase complex
VKAVQFDPITRDLLAHKVIRQITVAIKNGQLKAGDKLPSERDLAAQMGVGRPVIREALRALQLLRILEVRHGDGTYVRVVDEETLVDAYDVLLSVGGITLSDLFEARRFLEVSTASLAAKRASEEQVSRMRECAAKALEAIDDAERFLELDLELHSLVIEAAANPVLRTMMASISNLLRESRELTINLPGIRAQVAGDHERIAEAIARRDHAFAAAVMGEHIDRVRTAALRIAASSVARVEGL